MTALRSLYYKKYYKEAVLSIEMQENSISETGLCYPCAPGLRTMSVCDII